MNRLAAPAGLVESAIARARQVLGPGAERQIAERLIAIDVDRQRLYLVRGEQVVADYPCSTAERGIGGADGSFRTPPGVHRIHDRIGGGAPAGAVFESREPTGEVWRGEPDPRDLILTRVLTLDGCEPGINQGPGCDSRDRYIYIHGTNHEAALGQPVSHGCIRVANRAVIELHDLIQVGDPVVVVAIDAAPLPDPAQSRFHYAGVGGGGMSALAQFQAMLGGQASGSDRTFDRCGAPAIKAALERVGVRIVPQDGSGLDPLVDALIVSTAVEDSVPDVRAARAASTPIFHRSELLAAFVASHRTIAVAGTSGKSTVVAMIFELLRAVGRSPSLVTGAELLELAEQGYLGNAWVGESDLLVVEADESDGSLVRYAPAVGVILNLDKDHKETGEVQAMFEVFRARTREAVVVGEGENLAGFRPGALVFGRGPAAAFKATAIELEPERSRFVVEGVPCELPLPGLHNVDNALAALAAGHALGVPIAALAPGLARFRGVARRLQRIGSARGVTVIDDFAHNPAKLRAAPEAATDPRRLSATRVRPHALSPARAGGGVRFGPDPRRSPLAARDLLRRRHRHPRSLVDRSGGRSHHARYERRVRPEPRVAGRTTGRRGGSRRLDSRHGSAGSLPARALPRDPRRTRLAGWLKPERVPDRGLDQIEDDEERDQDPHHDFLRGRPAHDLEQRPDQGERGADDPEPPGPRLHVEGAPGERQLEDRADDQEEARNPAEKPGDHAHRAAEHREQPTRGRNPERAEESEDSLDQRHDGQQRDSEWTLHSPP
jgi:UDP-N-acetylmuramate--alanine ligase